jgi:tmRNA-binding protein
MQYENHNSKNYELLHRFMAGMRLDSVMVKHLRHGNDVGLSAAWVDIRDSSAYINLKDGGKPVRYQLLLNKNEIRKLASDLQQASTTIIPLRIEVKDMQHLHRQVFKVMIASARGLRQHDKRKRLIAEIHRKEMK